MRALPFAFALRLRGATALAAEPFDGSKPMECTALSGHDCLPDQKQCSPLKPESGKHPVLGIDVQAKSVRSPFRNALLPIEHTGNNQESLVLQGSDLQFAWSAIVHRSKGT